MSMFSTSFVKIIITNYLQLGDPIPVVWRQDIPRGRHSREGHVFHQYVRTQRPDPQHPFHRSSNANLPAQVRSRKNCPKPHKSNIANMFTGTPFPRECGYRSTSTKRNTLRPGSSPTPSSRGSRRRLPSTIWLRRPPWRAPRSPEPRRKNVGSKSCFRVSKTAMTTMMRTTETDVRVLGCKCIIHSVTMYIKIKTANAQEPTWAGLWDSDYLPLRVLIYCTRAES